MDKLYEAKMPRNLIGKCESQCKELEEMKVAFEKHTKDQKKHEELVDEILLFVKNNLIPAYEREVNSENAKRWIKEQAKSGSFWIGIAMSILGFFWAIIYIIKQALK